MKKMDSAYRLMELLLFERSEFLTYPKFVKISDDVDTQKVLKDEFKSLPTKVDAFGELHYNLAIYCLYEGFSHIYTSLPSDVDMIDFITFWHFFAEDGIYADGLQALRMDVFMAERDNSVSTYDAEHYLGTYLFYKDES